MSKYNKHILGCLAIICSLLFSVSTNAQSKNDLEAKKKLLQQEISLTNKMLDETRKNKELSLDELLKLKSKINARAGFISALNSELKLYNNQIKKSTDEIASLQEELTKLKEEYAKMIYYAYVHKGSFDKIMFVFASNSFNQAYKRLKYIQQYSAYRKSQVTNILKSQESLKQKITELDLAKQEKGAIISLEEQEKQKLAVEQVEKEGAVKQLQGKEQELKQDLSKKQAAAQKLQKAIQKIIEDEIRKAREAAKKAGNTSKGFPMTPEALKLSNSFAANKGKLPWPVLEGVITDRFGQHPHPVLSGIVINNNGIDISTTKGALARAIFEGEVSYVGIIPGEGKVIMIRHGEYLSVYSYMTEVYVNKGDKVTTKQHLGVLVNDADASKTDLHLEIWKGMTKLNPEYWIFRK
jgi:septal ring factor EnvC (AmiA/AmiB activator)